MFAYCDDPTVAGSEFFLMEYVEGRIFKDPQVAEAPREERRALYGELIRVLVEIHRVDLAELELEGLARSKTNYLARQISRWTKQYMASKTEDQEDMDRSARTVLLTSEAALRRAT